MKNSRKEAISILKSVAQTAKEFAQETRSRSVMNEETAAAGELTEPATQLNTGDNSEKKQWGGSAWDKVENPSDMHVTDIADTGDIELGKGLTAATVASFKAAAAYEDRQVGVKRRAAAGEPPIVPVRRVQTPFATTPVEAISKSCSTCQTVHKSDRPCPKCEHNSRITEAGPVRFRG